MSGVPEEYHEYADVFSKEKADTLPDHHPYDLKIDLEDGAEPPLGRMYSLLQTEVQALREFLNKNLHIGFIRPSKAGHGAPILFVKKKDSSLRLCVDFRSLNCLTKKDRYPLLLISNLLDAPGKARIYTKIDLRHAYHLVQIAEGDEAKTTFQTRYGSFEWLVIPKGLTNALSAFQRFMNEVFSDLINVSVIVYLDNILIYSNNLAEHQDLSKRYSNNSGSTVYSPALTSANSMRNGSNTSDTFSLPRDSPWTKPRSKPYRIGPSRGK